MRVNIYAEEMTNRVEIVSKEIDGQRFTGLRFYLELPVSYRQGAAGMAYPIKPDGIPTGQLQGPFIHRPGDDDSAAVTFWGKRDLRKLLEHAITLLDEHYSARKSLEHS